jgi:hypothetical protein
LILKQVPHQRIPQIVALEVVIQEVVTVVTVETVETQGVAIVEVETQGVVTVVTGVVVTDASNLRKILWKKSYAM